MYPLAKKQKLLPIPRNAKANPPAENPKTTSTTGPPPATEPYNRDNPRTTTYHSPDPQGGKGNKNSDPQGQKPSNKDSAGQKHIQSRKRAYRKQKRKTIFNQGCGVRYYGAKKACKHSPCHQSTQWTLPGKTHSLT